MRKLRAWAAASPPAEHQQRCRGLVQRIDELEKHMEVALEALNRPAESEVGSGMKWENESWDSLILLMHFILY